MIEAPEARILCRQLNETVRGKKITDVYTQFSPHKFAWFTGSSEEYAEQLSGKTIDHAQSQGGMVEITIGDKVLILTDGVNLRYLAPGSKLSAKHQLLIAFEDGFSPEYFLGLINADSAQKKSAKAFLATEQTIPGLGNGVLQDILYHTHIHPKKKISGLTDKERENLFYQIKETMNDIYHLGGRSTESDLFGANGKYVTCLSKDTAGLACPRCGETIVKENYLGGSIYYCRGCQPLPPA